MIEVLLSVTHYLEQFSKFTSRHKKQQNYCCQKVSTQTQKYVTNSHHISMSGSLPFNPID